MPFSFVRERRRSLQSFTHAACVPTSPSPTLNLLDVSRPSAVCVRDLPHHAPRDGLRMLQSRRDGADARTKWCLPPPPPPGDKRASQTDWRRGAAQHQASRRLCAHRRFYHLCRSTLPRSYPMSAATAKAAASGTPATGSAAPSDLKPCSRCMRDLPLDQYSGAQLKKKGKRVCRACVIKESGVGGGDASAATGAADSAAESSLVLRQMQEALASLDRPPAEAFPPPRPRRALGVLYPDLDAAFTADPRLAPPNPHFPPPASPGYWDSERGIAYYSYSSEAHQLPLLTRLIEADLSEPYSVFTYRYFLNFWPGLCWMAMAGVDCVGCIVCRLTRDKRGVRRGYIAMLAVNPSMRGGGIGTRLVQMAVRAMARLGADLVVLEAEVTNHPALCLYEKLNFVRETRMVRYYLLGSDAFRLKLWLRTPEEIEEQELLQDAAGDNSDHGAALQDDEED